MSRINIDWPSSDIDELKFAHDSVKHKFGCDRTIVQTFTDLLHGELEPDDLPSLMVMQYGGNHWVVNGNRRLLVYNKLAEFLNFDFPVLIVDFNMNTFQERVNTTTEGKKVWMRKYGKDWTVQFNKKIIEIVKHWTPPEESSSGDSDDDDDDDDDCDYD
eukprot:GHVR01181847.1.p1 GENE.GHVR01181847.1~~GHVR01181847.1.p1  ORF type:complete len:159 (-),score=26.45 GHVR01181847.1:394-870(-)